jgi:hypothetical protein
MMMKLMMKMMQLLLAHNEKLQLNFYLEQLAAEFGLINHYANQIQLDQILITVFQKVVHLEAVQNFASAFNPLLFQMIIFLFKFWHLIQILDIFALKQVYIFIQQKAKQLAKNF